MEKIVVKKDNQIVVRFDGFSDLGDHIRGKGNGSSESKFRSSFHRSTKNLSEAITQTVQGWDEPFSRIETIRENVRQRLGYIDTRVLRFDNAIDGQYLDVDSYLAGDPYCTLQVYEDTFKRTNRFVRILVDGSYSWMVKPEDIEIRGGAIVALCDALNVCGYTTEVWVACNQSSSNYKNRGSLLSVLVPVQLQGTPWDIRSASFPLANGDHLRRSVFAVMENLTEKEREVFGVGGNYGIPNRSTKGSLADLHCGGADLICTNDSGEIDHIVRDPIKWVLTQCKNLGVISEEESI
jgi:hypothetical protein